MWETIDLDDHEKVINFLQGQSDRIKELEKREEQLLSEIEDFQELLTKNDDVCHKRVIALIDEKITIYNKAAKNKDRPDIANLNYVAKIVLEALKEELEE